MRDLRMLFSMFARLSVIIFDSKKIIGLAGCSCCVKPGISRFESDSEGSIQNDDGGKTWLLLVPRLFAKVSHWPG
jgi:hypothetical protein